MNHIFDFFLEPTHNTPNSQIALEAMLLFLVLPVFGMPNRKIS